MRKIVRIFFLRAVWFPLEETRKKKFIGYYLVIKEVKIWVESSLDEVIRDGFGGGAFAKQSE